jgi:hypothetical protein
VRTIGISGRQRLGGNAETFRARHTSRPRRAHSTSWSGRAGGAGRAVAGVCLAAIVTIELRAAVGTIDVPGWERLGNDTQAFRPRRTDGPGRAERPLGPDGTLSAWHTLRAGCTGRAGRAGRAGRSTRTERATGTKRSSEVRKRGHQAKALAGTDPQE